jgi:hypothetical protein
VYTLHRCPGSTTWLGNVNTWFASSRSVHPLRLTLLFVLLCSSTYSSAAEAVVPIQATSLMTTSRRLA